MIQLTDEQRKAIQEGQAVRISDNGQEFILLHADHYQRLPSGEDDDRWTREELDAARKEAVALLDILGTEPAR